VARRLLLSGDARLLTLTGPPGVGKTTLAVTVARSVLDQFPHGACFVDLVPISDPADVALTIAEALDEPERPACPAAPPFGTAGEPGPVASAEASASDASFVDAAPASGLAVPPRCRQRQSGTTFSRWYRFSALQVSSTSGASVTTRS
jgi:DNA polymerase III delta prime subunit